MGEKDLIKVILESSDKIISLSSRIALIGGGLWFLIYSYFIAKDFPRSIEIHSLYYIFVVSMILVFFIVYPLMFYLYIRIIEENNSEEKNLTKIGKFLHTLSKISHILFTNLLLIVYLLINIGLLFMIILRDDFSIFTIFGYNKYTIIIFFIIFQVLIFLLLEIFLIFLKHKENKNTLFYLIIIFILIIIAYAGFFLTAPFQLLKIGYFEANLTLEKEYVEKSGLKTYLEKCQPECLDKQPEEKNETKKLQEKNGSNNQTQDKQDNNYCGDFRIHIPSDKVIAIEYSKKEDNKSNSAQQLLCNLEHKYKFFIFLRTGSEYIVGCCKKL